MPIWLVTFLTNLLEPIIMSIIAKLELSARISSLEKKQEASKDAFDQLAKADSNFEIKAAAAAISNSWNN